ncbi:FAD/FMN-containing dehydrogenase [Collimonas sp. OK307]|uniref:FAD-binding oxidoreductase n=1 Tax=Collimonas sp. OK307 TaxID=1801620 RepID=UPI0008E6E0D7|nr:FAD-binding oxidoreductase [Collimonas sp. OK307]SFH71967.1 FAD/FMN-containing dehydrogenase [Collimonas sp. OK307]
MSTSLHIDTLSAIVGRVNCLTDESDLVSYTTDYRKVYSGAAMAAVRPGSTKEVSEVMAYCYEHGIAIVPQGGNTSLQGGAVPVSNAGLCIVLSLSRLNKIRSIDPVNDTLILEAGVTLAAARTAAESVQRLFPLRIGSEGSCQIGGNLSTNAGGTAVLRYGNMRDLVLGVEVVLPDGAIWNGLKTLRKDNTGYDLKQLFVGSEGTLGVITSAVLKLVPRPRSTSTALVATKSPATALSLLGRLKTRLGNDVTAFELISAPAMKLVQEWLRDEEPLFASKHDWMVLIEISSHSDQDDINDAFYEVLTESYDKDLVLDALLATTEGQAQRLWRLREEISDAQTRTGGSIRCDISVPLSAVPEFIERASAKVLDLEPATRMVIYGHMGDGNVHFNPLRPDGVSATEFMSKWHTEVTLAVDAVALSLEGSISAEHGVGVAKRDELLHVKQELELLISWRIKNALDPRNLLNPGKMLPAISSFSRSQS